MRPLAIITGIFVLALSANAHAWWRPFNDGDGYDNQRWNNRNNSNWNNNLYDRWDDSVLGDLMGDMVGDMDVEMKFKVKAKGKGRSDTNNRWNGNNRWYNNNRYNAYNYSDYINQRNAPYGYNNYYAPPAYNNYYAPEGQNNSNRGGYPGKYPVNYGPQYQQPSRSLPVAQPVIR